MEHSVRASVEALLAQVPPGVDVVAAVKTQSPERILEALEAGIRHIGHNYIQEAKASHPSVGARARWHFIGHLQTNKAREAARLFDMVQTVDSLRLAQALDQECRKLSRTLDILLEVNSGREPNKAGLPPEEVLDAARQIAPLPNVRIRGLMTMGPLLADPEAYRPYFRLTRDLFRELADAQLPGVEAACLSMGMSDSWRVAVEEGATMVRMGTLLFGLRPVRG